MPAIIHPVNDRTRVILSVVENVQRKQLNPIEEAEAYDDLRKLMTQRQVAQIVGKHEVDISATLSLLRLPGSVKDMVRAGQLTRDHAFEILRVPEDQREALARDVLEHKVPAMRLRAIRRSKKAKADPQSTAGLSEKQALLRTLADAQRAIDELFYVASGRDSSTDARPRRDRAIELIDWAKGMVDPLHAEQWASLHQKEAS